MDKLKKYVAFTALGCLAILAAGWTLVVSPKRAESAELKLQAQETLAANEQLKTKLGVLKGQAKELPKEQAKLAAIAAKIPANPALPGLIRALTGASLKAGVELVSVAPGVAAPKTVAAPAAPAAAPAAPASSAPVTPGAPAASNLASIPLTLNIAGGYFDIQRFLAELEKLPRAFRATAVTINPGANPLKKTQTGVEEGRALISTITGEVYMSLTAPAAPAAPAAATTGGTP